MHNGNGPWVCFFCSEEILPDEKPRSRRSLCIHHKNHNHDDNRKSNLKASHWACHTRHHKVGVANTSEQRAKISAALKGRVKTPEHLAAIKANHVGMTGRHCSPEHKAKISASLMGRPKPEVSAALMGRKRPDISASIKKHWAEKRRVSI